MNNKYSAYYGIKDTRGNPTDTINTQYRSYDKRYFTEDDYKLIVSTAKEILKEDWFKSGWDCGSEDAPIRAALDLSIYTANNNLYQSKIDSETYNMLLNRLAGWGYDSFSDTILPILKGKRSNLAMDSSIKTLFKVAHNIRKVRPKEAVELIRSARSLMGAKQVIAEDKVYFERALKEMGRVLELDDLEGFSKILKRVVEKMRKVGSVKLATDDMDKSAKKINKLIEEALELSEKDQKKIIDPLKDIVEELEKTVNTAELDAVGLNQFIGSLHDAIEDAIDNITTDPSTEKGPPTERGWPPKKTSSIFISSLINTAWRHPEVRGELIPIIVAAMKGDKDSEKPSLKKPSPKKPSPKKDSPKSEDKDSGIKKSSSNRRISKTYSYKDLDW